MNMSINCIYNLDISEEEIASFRCKHKKTEVFVICNVYNTVDYIEQIIKGCISQKTSFLYHVLFFDDASTDGTSEIIRRYVEDNPN